MQRVSRIVLGIVTMLFCTVAIASARPVVALKLSGTVAERASDGSVKTVPAQASPLKAGQVIRWDIAAVNSGDTAAAHLIPQGKIPAGTTYVPGSASTANAVRVEFSLDGGKTWSASPMVTVKKADGTTEQRKADPSTYTQLRWISDKALAPKAAAHYVYETKVK